jgi:WD40 repeat protein
VRRHSPLLGGILVLAACGSSAASTIDTHNAKRLEVSRISPDALASAPEPRTEGGSVVWTAPNRKWAIRLEKSHPIRLVAVPAGKTLDTLATRDAAVAAWTRDSKTFAVGDRKGLISVWGEFDHRTYDLHGPPHSVTALAFSPDRTLLVEAADDRRVRLWNTHTKQVVVTIRLSAVADRLLFPADGRRILAGNEKRAWQLRLPR